MPTQDEWIESQTGVNPETKCCICGITARESYKLGPVNTGINHPEYCRTYSFYSNVKKEMFCPRCHKESEIKALMDLLEARENKRKE